jgi:hypothetical protein
MNVPFTAIYGTRLEWLRDTAHQVWNLDSSIAVTSRGDILVYLATDGLLRASNRRLRDVPAKDLAAERPPGAVFALLSFLCGF